MSLRNADLARALDQKRIQAEEKLKALNTARLKKGTELYELQGKYDQDVAKQIQLESELARLSNSRLKADRDRAKALAKEVADGKVALNETQRYIREKEKEINLSEKAADDQLNLTKQIQDSVVANEKNNKELEKEGKLLKEAENQKKKLGLYSVVQEKFNTKFLDDWYKIIESGNTFLAWVTFFKLALESALKFNAISVDVSKNLGYSASEADRVAQNLVEVAAHSGNVNVTLKNAGEAMAQLNESTGYVAEYSADALETQIMLTKQFGLQADEAARFYQFSVLTGKSSSQINKEMVGAFVAARNQLRVGIPFKATLAEASKVSGRLAANLQNNPAAIVKAVAQAKAFGTSLEQVAKQGDSLLNFETSLESELKAELLTGKQLNLERARAAALTGDQVTLAEELNKNVGSLEDFQKMNVLQQRSLAEAMGLTADELADQLKKQKLAEETGKSLAQINEEEALEAEKRQKIQDKFNQAMEKLQDLIGNLVAGPFAMFLDGLTTAVTWIGYILRPIQWIADLAGVIGELFSSWAEKLGPFGILIKGIAGVAIVLAAYGAYAALAWIPVVGPILGAAAAVAVLAKGFSALAGAKKAGDLAYTPGEGPVVSTQEGGIFQGTKNDQVAMFPGAVDMAKEGGGKVVAPSIDLTPLIAAVNAVKDSVDKLYSKDTTIDMDTRAVGTTLSQKTTRTA